MKYFIDLDDTLLFTTALNNDAYNYALEKFGYPRIDTSSRITRSNLGFVNIEHINSIINLKQQYFSLDWIANRTILNNSLLSKIKNLNKENCFLWTKADENRVKTIWKAFNLKQYFDRFIIDCKSSFEQSIKNIQQYTNEKNFIIYENNQSFFDNKSVEVIDEIAKIFCNILYHSPFLRQL